ncbi:hypothetical protein FRB99_002725 [Tulasnella sp. 403]|nr:hypothetical protein FRB99_002725 [Tulasnella sp. 403]
MQTALLDYATYLILMLIITMVEAAATKKKTKTKTTKTKTKIVIKTSGSGTKTPLSKKGQIIAGSIAGGLVLICGTCIAISVIRDAIKKKRLEAEKAEKGKEDEKQADDLEGGGQKPELASSSIAEPPPTYTPSHTLPDIRTPEGDPEKGESMGEAIVGEGREKDDPFAVGKTTDDSTKPAPFKLF